MNKFRKTQTVVGLSILTALTGFSLRAFAGGFQLFEENVTNMGNAYAGVGAQADDASTEFYNPAGMTRLDRPQFVVSGSFIDVDADVNIKSAITTNTTRINGVPFATFTQNIPGTTDIHPGQPAGIPGFHFVYPFCNKWALGFGVGVPFGLETIYPDDSAVRNLATTSAVETIDLGPSIAYQFNPHFSVGVGADVLWMSATFDQAIPDPIPGNSNGSLGIFTNEGDSWGWGWHAGALYQYDAATRVGLTYHSRVRENIEGRAIADLTIGPEPALDLPQFPLDLTGNFSSSVTLPDWVDLSGYHDFNDQWAALASVEYTHWNLIQTLNANYAGTIGEAIPNAQLPFNFRNTWRVAGGINYKPTPKWTVRTGVAWDESPVKDDTSRTFRLPDADRIWLALGAQYIINREFTIDAGYAHLFIKKDSINNTQFINAGLTIPIINTNVAFNAANTGVADVTANVNEVGAQLTWNIM